jgi:hypothetical protein
VFLTLEAYTEMLVNVSSSLPDRTKSFLDQHDVDLVVSDYLAGVAEEVSSDLMDFEEFVDVVSISCC